MLAESSVAVAWIGLAGLVVASIVGPAVLMQLRRLNERNDRQHAEAAKDRQQCSAERHAEYADLMRRLDRFERDMQATRDETAALTRLFADHTVEEVSRYAAITLALGRLVGPQVMRAAEDAAGVDDR